MERFDGVLLVSDFDNTMVDTASSFRDGGKMPLPCSRNLEALAEFMAQGGTFAVATGRALAAFEKMAPYVPMNAPAVLCNGAALYDFETKTYLDTNFLPPVTRTRIQAVLDRFPAVAAEAYHIGNTIYGVHPNEITRHHERITQVAVTEAAALEQVPDPLGKLLLEGTHEQLLEVYEYLQQQNWREEYEVIFSDQRLLEVTARGAGKGAMVQRLAQRLNIAPENIYCVGDEANDLSMLRLAARGFAPANCAEAVRESGAEIVCSAAEGALADVIEILKTRYPERG